MRRAVREYRYEVNEGRMTEECIQHLTQLQKDWERHRVKLGVEALRKEVLFYATFVPFAKLTHRLYSVTRTTRVFRRLQPSLEASTGPHLLPLP